MTLSCLSAIFLEFRQIWQNTEKGLRLGFKNRYDILLLHFIRHHTQQLKTDQIWRAQMQDAVHKTSILEECLQEQCIFRHKYGT